MRAGVIETPTPPWQGGVIPLNHARINITAISYTIELKNKRERGIIDNMLKTVDKSVDMCIRDKSLKNKS